MAGVPRVVLISIDNLRSDCVGANADKSALMKYDIKDFAKTPVLDSLAENGTALFNCFSAAPYTTASHASIFTGLFPAHHGVREYFRTSLADNVKTVFQYFKDAGYITIMATDFPFLLGKHLGFLKSVDFYIVENDQEVMKLLNSYRSEKVFAFMHFGNVHSPYGFNSLADDGDKFVSKVETLGDILGVPEQLELRKEWLERGRTTRERLLRQRYFKCIDVLYEQGRYDDIMQLYVEGVSYFDANRFNRLVRRMRELNLFQDSVIAIVADHGEQYDEYTHAHHDGLWEGVINVPFIIIGDGVPRGKINKSLCRTVDIIPTLLHIARVQPSFEENERRFDGVNLAECIWNDEAIELTSLGETWFGPAEILLSFMAMCQSSKRLSRVKRMANVRLEYVRKRDWKLIIRTELDQDSESVWLFEIERDRRERNNMANQFPDIVRTMRADIEEHRRIAPREALTLDDRGLLELESGLKHLGYLKDGK